MTARLLANAEPIWHPLAVRPHSKGEKPGDLPIQAPTKFDLIISMKTAKAMQLAMPGPPLLRADALVE